MTREGETKIGPRTFVWGTRTFVMGIVNVTPDSFSGDGLVNASGPVTIDAAVALARTMAEEGADVLDVGGESTRPGHSPVEADEELARVVPVIRAVHDALPDMPLSIDTTKPVVAAAALDAGAHLVNDVWGVAPDDSLARLAAERGVAIVLMHNRREARYTALLPEILGELEAAIERAMAAGVRRDRILVDPGFGFGKTAEHNLTVLARLAEFKELGVPLLAGLSRKSTIGKVTGRPTAERLAGSLAMALLAVQRGATILRVHDVRETRDVIAVWEAVRTA